MFRVQHCDPSRLRSEYQCHRLLVMITSVKHDFSRFVLGATATVSPPYELSHCNIVLYQFRNSVQGETPHVCFTSEFHQSQEHLLLLACHLQPGVDRQETSTFFYSQQVISAVESRHRHRYRQAQMYRYAEQKGTRSKPRGHIKSEWARKPESNTLETRVRVRTRPAAPLSLY